MAWFASMYPPPADSDGQKKIRVTELTSPQTGMVVFAKAVLEGLSSGRSGNPLET